MLCTSNLRLAHPLLEHVDGIALGVAGNVWAVANGRNAIVVAYASGRVEDVFRNPVNAAGLRNAAGDAAGNTHIVEFPASPYLVGHRLCTSTFDQDNRDNSPAAAGELDGPTGTLRGKISCLDAVLPVPGLPLPIRAD